MGSPHCSHVVLLMRLTRAPSPTTNLLSLSIHLHSFLVSHSTFHFHLHTPPHAPLPMFLHHQISLLSINWHHHPPLSYNYMYLHLSPYSPEVGLPCSKDEKPLDIWHTSLVKNWYLSKTTGVPVLSGAFPFRMIAVLFTCEDQLIVIKVTSRNSSLKFFTLPI